MRCGPGWPASGRTRGQRAIMIYWMADHDAVLFDLDGVLVDSRVPFARSVNSALISHGLTPRLEHELYQYLGLRFTKGSARS
jgi:phosphoglycolate phosphatase-like HAD superfamily hydrolase